MFTWTNNSVVTAAVFIFETGGITLTGIGRIHSVLIAAIHAGIISSRYCNSITRSSIQFSFINKTSDSVTWESDLIHPNPSKPIDLIAASRVLRKENWNQFLKETVTYSLPEMWTGRKRPMPRLKWQRPKWRLISTYWLVSVKWLQLNHGVRDIELNSLLEVPTVSNCYISIY